MNDEINFYMGHNEEKKEKSQRFLKIEDCIFYLSPTNSVLSRGMH
jgi:hypothetical protein